MRAFSAETSLIRRIGFAALTATMLAPLAAIAQNPPPAPPPTSGAGAGAKPAVVVPAGATAAQAAAGAMGKNISNSDIADAIKNSGLSETQVRSKLQQAGYDTKLADPFFSGGSVGAPVASNPQSNAAFISALQELGIVNYAGQKLPGADTPEDIDGEADKTSKERKLGGRGSGIFGKDLFSTKSTIFDPVIYGPVDASYRIGVGDELQLVMTGETELAYALDVRRDGSVVLPTVGKVQIAGLTLDGARTVLKRDLGRMYSGIGTGKIDADLTMSKIRTNVVTLIGEVENPGQYQVSALGTVFHALTKAGGPTARGSFRRVEVRRGGKTVREIDLYDYLLLGDASNDIRTEQGDIIFVPLDTRAVAISGAVRRQGIFELLPKEGFASLRKFAGGFLASAATDRIQIDRILPPNQRRAGIDRVILDINVGDNPAVLDTVQLFDNDMISVFSIGELRRNTVSVKGQVFEPGSYEWKTGMKLGELMDKAKGLLPWSLTDRIKLERGVANTGHYELFNLDVNDSTGKNFVLNEFDQVSVLDGRTFYPAGEITIAGEVVAPGTQALMERQTLKDIIDVAGGIKEAASHVELVRRRTGRDYSDTASVVMQFPLDANHRLSPEALSLPLQASDRIIVRTSPGYRTLGSVNVLGLFKYPGLYPLENAQESMSSVVRRAGGILPIAFVPGFRVSRNGRTVPIDFNKMMKGVPEHDITLMPGDQLQIEGSPGVVNVTGSVEQPVSVPFDPSWDLSDYINAAGGFTQAANKKSVVVTYLSGAVKRRRTWHSDPTVQPGALIAVGAKPAETSGNGEGLTKVMQITTTLVGLLIGYKAISK